MDEKINRLIEEIEADLERAKNARRNLRLIIRLGRTDGMFDELGSNVVSVKAYEEQCHAEYNRYNGEIEAYQSVLWEIRKAFNIPALQPDEDNNAN